MNTFVLATVVAEMSVSDVLPGAIGWIVGLGIGLVVARLLVGRRLETARE